MQIILIILVVAAALYTGFILLRGVIGLANNQSPQQSQKLMRQRVMFQAITIMLAVLLLLSFGGSR